MKLLTQFPPMTLFIVLILAWAWYRMFKSFKKTQTGPRIRLFRRRNPEAAAPPKQYRLMGFDQYDKTHYLIGDYPSRSLAVKKARRYALRPNGLPIDFSDYFHVYDDKGICLYASCNEKKGDSPPPFRVWVDDNYNPGPENRIFHDDFQTLEQAVNACQAIVDKDIREMIRRELPVSQMLDAYHRGGRDPFVERSLAFSAWNYAEQRINALGQTAPDQRP